ncbi:hypothetical protein [Burkholderia mayonis]|uniref:Uncharacterized protein n=1 Tax=Burkholderia mayonis TaxID=1385591 RepID=A0A1B4FV46_9BURK|nr:hypothetical protein [Burkholderia mayonis]AOJ07514.1 hypothetical protein WS71_09485 [Burkholderia mayonis]KVE56484.1 hypothetical protein WS71_28525 [Burkholderia mayonis]
MRAVISATGDTGIQNVPPQSNRSALDAFRRNEAPCVKSERRLWPRAVWRCMALYGTYSADCATRDESQRHDCIVSPANDRVGNACSGDASDT